jgi:hypothetical protein
MTCSAKAKTPSPPLRPVERTRLAPGRIRKRQHQHRRGSHLEIHCVTFADFTFKKSSTEHKSKSVISVLQLARVVVTLAGAHLDR